MTTATISPKFQVVIPKEVREQLRIKSGMKVDFVIFGGRISMIPIRPISELRGALKGMDTTIIREPDREL